MAVIHGTKNNFENDVLKSDLPVLVDFWAEWCGPCKMIGPIIEELGTELEGKAKVVKVNVDDAQELAGQYGIMSIPTLILFKGGEAVEQMIGAISKEQMLAKINPHIG